LKIVCEIAGPIEKTRLGPSNKLLNEELEKPPVAESAMFQGAPQCRVRTALAPRRR
jgi:hypothetical protein